LTITSPPPEIMEMAFPMVRYGLPLVPLPVVSFPVVATHFAVDGFDAMAVE